MHPAQDARRREALPGAPARPKGSLIHALRLALAVLLALSLAPGCGRTVNDYLQEAASGAREDVSYAIGQIQLILVAKERSGEDFDEGDLAALRYLEEVALEGSNRLNRAEAIAALGRLRTWYRPDRIERFLEDDFWLARLEAVDTLRRLGSVEQVEVLLEALADETRAEVRVEMVKTLGVLGGPRALRALFETFLENLTRPTDEQLHAFLALRDLTGLDHQLHERQKWREEFESRFGGAEEDPGGRS